MDLSKLTPDILRELMTLLKEKESLQADIAEVDGKMDQVLKGQKTVPALEKKKKPASKKREVARREGGQLQSVLSTLAKTGTSGLRIPEIQKEVEISAAYLNVLLGAQVKAGTVIRVSRGVYASAAPAQADGPAGQDGSF